MCKQVELILDDVKYNIAYLYKLFIVV